MTTSRREPTTVRDWFDLVEPAPPKALRARLAELVSHHADRPATEVPEVCLDAGEALLEGLLASGATSRDSALDLLAVDALVTYAFQAAADDPERIEARATVAMARISALPETLRG